MKFLKRGFTLIELLVVIAIIAILAAILFPVFAQAKLAAKKASAISNVKQTATGTVIYTTDNDDCFPSSYSYISGTANAVWAGYGALIPAGWGNDGYYVKAEDENQWANSTNPYRKNWGILEETGMQLEPKPYWVTLNPTGPARQKASWAMNGLLHCLNGSVVGAPSTVTMFWPGQGAVIHDGVAYSTPYLDCYQSAPVCRWSATTGPQGQTSGLGAGMMWYTDPGGDFTYWAYGKTIPFVNVDTSAKVRPVGSAPMQYNNNPFGDPFAMYDAQGIEWAFYFCYAPGTSSGIAYPCFFRPDRDQYGK